MKRQTPASRKIANVFLSVVLVLGLAPVPAYAQPADNAGAAPAAAEGSASAIEGSGAAVLDVPESPSGFAAPNLCLPLPNCKMLPSALLLNLQPPLRKRPSAPCSLLAGCKRARASGKSMPRATLRCVRWATVLRAKCMEAGEVLPDCPGMISACQ